MRRDESKGVAGAASPVAPAGMEQRGQGCPAGGEPGQRVTVAPPRPPPPPRGVGGWLPEQ